MQSKNKSIVSVIVPAYNEEAHIKECLISIKNQTYKNIQLIVVNDGSTDSTGQIARKYADIFIDQRHQGPGIARNLGVEKAKGEILVFVDADICLDKDYIKYIIKPIVEHKSLATFTKEEYVANPENIWSRCFCIDNNMPINRRIPLASSNENTKFRAINKKYFYQTGQYRIDTGYGEDEILLKAEAIAATGAICYHFNPDSLIEVFYSARWIGRSIKMKKQFRNFLRYSFVNSILISFKKIRKGSPFQFLVYKLTFDFGVLCGLMNKNGKNNFAK